jgi:hypothetical protein
LIANPSPTTHIRIVLLWKLDSRRFASSSVTGYSRHIEQEQVETLSIKTDRRKGMDRQIAERKARQYG